MIGGPNHARVQHLCAMIAMDLAAALDRVRELGPKRKLRGHALLRAGEALGRADQQLTYDMPWHTVEGHLAGMRAQWLLEEVRSLVRLRAGEATYERTHYGFYFRPIAELARNHVEFRDSWRRDLYRRAA